MNTLEIENIDTIEYDLENGFVYAVDIEGDNLFQACLMQRKDENGYKKVINSDDCGHDWGLCGDWNDTLNYENLEASLSVFLKSCRKAGIKVI